MITHLAAREQPATRAARGVAATPIHTPIVPAGAEAAAVSEEQR